MGIGERHYRLFLQMELINDILVTGSAGFIGFHLLGSYWIRVGK